ncbi:hypothetical protein FQA39_LY13969 [Lamprigera yunnana]|nr:hypothetical protein FQA39_LY13969 [Lamprigera yunnana]
MMESTEIRKLPPSSLRELVQILEYNESWKKLMDKIPKVLEKDRYECPLHKNNLRKYRSEHFRLIENASLKSGRACTEILFDEWGTSGRVRPALGHLLYLLTSVELFRAADFIAVNLLNTDPPKRPDTGPPAHVTIPNIPDLKMQEVERILDSLDYPSSLISNLANNNSDVNLNKNNSSMMHIIPKIVITEIRESNIPLIIDNSESRHQKRLSHQNVPVQEETAQVTISDMIKFSETELNVSLPTSTVPHLSDLLVSSSDNQSHSETEVNPILPAISMIYNETKEQNVPALSDLMVVNLPPLSDLLENVSPESQSSELPPNLSIFNANESNEFLPQISALNAAEPVMPQSNILNAAEPTMPQLSVLLTNANSSSAQFLPISSLLSSTTSEQCNHSSDSTNSNSSQLSRQMCPSPLPNLSLNTMLPHFTYTEIEVATNAFDETPYKNNGRFLGSGAFGSVFLALKICNKPVAVKKLVLNNIVTLDDTVTRQFKNEVEVLSKYKHENLLSLIGYSCDGATYCLLYEFMAGGALKDRLQSMQYEDKLIWTDRMYIALGTARAVSYLHTAYSTPLIHRDIKTANILLDSHNKPKLCDFGLVKLITNQNTNTSTTAFGTSAYMAREAFRGDVSVKLDTFSFGVVLLELITGLPPLDENREGLDIVTHIEEVCDDETGIQPLIDNKAGSWITKDKNFAEELYKISTWCLQENKKKRPTMVEVSEQLTELINLHS